MPNYLYRISIIFLCAFIFSTTVSSISAKTSENSLAPDFTLPIIGKEGNVNLNDLKGHVVYIDFWATWCPPCRKSFPWMEEMHTRYHKQGLTIVAISLDSKYNLAEKFIQELKPSFISAHDPAKKTAKLYNLRAMPSSFLIDRNGKIISTHLGFRTSKIKIIEAEIKAALSQ